jgi:hypothetical protein
MTSTYPAGESYAAFRDAGRLAFHVPVAARTRVTRINGKNLAESVEIQNLDSGVRRTVHWDTVITTGDWIPDDELARSAGLGIDPATRGPASTAPFAPAHPAFRRWPPAAPCRHCRHRRARWPHVGAQVRQWLRTRHAPGSGVTLIADPPLRWIVPRSCGPATPPPPATAS